MSSADMNKEDMDYVEAKILSHDSHLIIFWKVSAPKLLSWKEPVQVFQVSCRKLKRPTWIDHWSGNKQIIVYRDR